MKNYTSPCLFDKSILILSIVFVRTLLTAAGTAIDPLKVIKVKGGFLLLLGKSVWIQDSLKTQSGEESSSSGRFNPVGPLQQSRCLGSYPP